MNLFFFPYAGGSRYSYNHFKPFISKEIEMIPIEIPGRGDRFDEPLLTSIEPIVADIYSNICEKINQPYAFYGHSMGSLLAYLVTKMIIKNNHISPKYLFLSGNGGPQTKSKNRSRHTLPKDEFIEEVQKMDGIPKDLLQDEIVLEYIEPILRSDFTSIETYKYEASNPFDIPMLIMYGTEDSISPAEMWVWQKETLNEIQVVQFPGKHFFIFDNAQAIMQLINARLINI